MKIVTWNVNGLRACLRHGFLERAAEFDADVILIQETQVNAPLSEIDGLTYRTGASGRTAYVSRCAANASGHAGGTSTYKAAWSFAERKGYSGTLCLFRATPVSVTRGMGFQSLDAEGRVITLEYKAIEVW